MGHPNLKDTIPLFSFTPKGTIAINFIK